mgnify:CR=1 FL=1
MRFWNDGKGETNMVQNRFTKYLVVSVHRKKSAVLQSRRKIRNSENFTDDWDALPEIAVEEDYTQQVSSPLDIFFARILDEKEFYDLAIELGMGYKGVAAAYRCRSPEASYAGRGVWRRMWWSR